MPKPPTESELKYRLLPRDYLRLRARFPKAPSAELSNVYFDDSRTLALRKNRIGLRIRFRRGKAPVMTLKYPPPRERRGPGGFKVRLEYEASLPMATARAVAKGTKSIATLPVLPARVLRKRLSPKTLSTVGPLGTMKMRRTSIPFEGLCLELDRFEIRGRRFYELEVETKTPRAADAIVRALLRELRIAARPHLISKLGRFFQVTGGKKKRR